MRHQLLPPQNWFSASLVNANNRFFVCVCSVVLCWHRLLLTLVFVNFLAWNILKVRTTFQLSIFYFWIKMAEHHYIMFQQAHPSAHIINFVPCWYFLVPHWLLFSHCTWTSRHLVFYQHLICSTKLQSISWLTMLSCHFFLFWKKYICIIYIMISYLGSVSLCGSHTASQDWKAGRVPPPPSYCQIQSPWLSLNRTKWTAC